MAGDYPAPLANVPGLGIEKPLGAIGEELKKESGGVGRHHDKIITVALSEGVLLVSPGCYRLREARLFAPVPAQCAA